LLFKWVADGFLSDDPRLEASPAERVVFMCLTIRQLAVIDSSSGRGIVPRTGFTLVELMEVIAIILVLMGHAWSLVLGWLSFGAFLRDSPVFPVAPFCS